MKQRRISLTIKLPVLYCTYKALLRPGTPTAPTRGRLAALNCSCPQVILEPYLKLTYFVLSIFLLVTRFSYSSHFSPPLLFLSLLQFLIRRHYFSISFPQFSFVLLESAFFLAREWVRCHTGYIQHVGWCFKPALIISTFATFPKAAQSGCLKQAIGQV